MKIQEATKSESGSILLMSILIMASLVTAASSYGAITIQNLRQSIAVDNGIRAHYAAESGIEDALYEIRKNETSISSMDSHGSLSNSGTWDRTISKNKQQLTKDISENDFWEINLFDADSSLSPLSSPIKSLKLAWTGDGSEWVEAQIVPWTAGGTLGIPTEQLFSSASNPAIVNLLDSTSSLYRVRIKALYSDITDMTVTAYSNLNAGGSQINVPGFLTIYSTGEFSRANQVVRAQMSHRATLSGNFGYVLLSEQDLVK